MEVRELKAMLNTVPDDYAVLVAGESGPSCNICDKMISEESKEVTLLIAGPDDEEAVIKLCE